jgi:hypothetical protein
MGGYPKNSAQNYLHSLGEIDECDDLRDAYARLREGIRRYEQAGRPVPEELLLRERQVVMELAAQSQGR